MSLVELTITHPLDETRLLMRKENPDGGTTVPQWGDSREKAQFGGQLVNVSATDAPILVDHFIPSNRRRCRERGYKKGDR
jgi:hypothetical protein